MAAQYTKENENFSRSIHIVLELLPLPLRHILQNEIPTVDIWTKASQHTSFVNRLNAEQKTILQNVSMLGDYSECDISLIYTVLRNLTDWNRKRTSSIKTYVPDIEKIRDIRNKFGHGTSAKLTQQQYQDFRTDVKGILTRMDFHLPGNIP